MSVVSGIFGSFARNFATTHTNLTRTRYAATRIPRNLPNTFVPKYLIDRDVTRQYSKGGRGPCGAIIRHHQGGGAVRNYRKVDHMIVPHVSQHGIDTKEEIFQEKVVSVVYDPNRTGRLVLVVGRLYDKYRLVLQAEGMEPGEVFNVSRGPPPPLSEFSPGDTYPIKYFPIGSFVYNVEIFPDSGGRLARAAGAYLIVKGTVMEKNKLRVSLAHPTKNYTFCVDGVCMASYGRISNKIHKDLLTGKAGRNWWANRRPRGRIGWKRHRNFKKLRKPLRTEILSWEVHRKFCIRRFRPE